MYWESLTTSLRAIRRDLRGIDDRDWARVRNVVLEAHDLDGRLIVVVGLLTAHGFRVTTELNTDVLEGFDTYLVWACRDHPDRVSGRTHRGRACSAG